MITNLFWIGEEEYYIIEEGFLKENKKLKYIKNFGN